MFFLTHEKDFSVFLVVGGAETTPPAALKFFPAAEGEDLETDFRVRAER